MTPTKDHKKEFAKEMAKLTKEIFGMKNPKLFKEYCEAYDTLRMADVLFNKYGAVKCAAIRQVFQHISSDYLKMKSSKGGLESVMDILLSSKTVRKVVYE